MSGDRVPLRNNDTVPPERCCSNIHAAPPRLPGALVHAGKSSISFPARLRSGSHLLAFLRGDPEISWSTNPSVCLLIVFLFHLTTSCFFYECVICVFVCVCKVCVLRWHLSLYVYTESPPSPSGFNALFFSFFLHPPPPIISHQTMKIGSFP